MKTLLLDYRNWKEVGETAESETMVEVTLGDGYALKAN